MARGELLEREAGKEGVFHDDGRLVRQVCPGGRRPQEVYPAGDTRSLHHDPGETPPVGSHVPRARDGIVPVILRHRLNDA